VHPLNFPLLADENIHPDVVRFLRDQGTDVCSVTEEGLAGQDNLTLLRRAYQENRVMLTHDSDFGTLAIMQREPVHRHCLSETGAYSRGIHHSDYKDAGFSDH
jgi:predicted nuclease of predicted toxin-antitoxin system